MSTPATPEAYERYSAWCKWAKENREPGVILWPYEGCTVDAIVLARAYCEERESGNARLRDAAVDLLAACKEAMEYLRKYYGNDKYEVMGGPPSALYMTLLEATIKAEHP